MNHVYLALGSNRGDRQNNLLTAIKKLEEEAGKIALVSSLYETQPWQMNDATHFLNQVILLDTGLTAPNLIKVIFTIEESLGRARSNSNVYEPRTIDIDILFFNNEILNSSILTIPHPQIAKRRFVLEPLSEIAPAYIHPQLNKSVTELLSSCTDEHSISKLVSE